MKGDGRGGGDESPTEGDEADNMNQKLLGCRSIAADLERSLAAVRRSTSTARSDAAGPQGRARLKALVLAKRKAVGDLRRRVLQTRARIEGDGQADESRAKSMAEFIAKSQEEWPDEAGLMAAARRVGLAECLSRMRRAVADLADEGRPPGAVEAARQALASLQASVAASRRDLEGATRACLKFRYWLIRETISYVAAVLIQTLPARPALQELPHPRGAAVHGGRVRRRR
jgi:hypothetical protein